VKALMRNLHRGFYNPFALVYLLFRVLTRFLLGKKRRKAILRTLHWETIYEFLDWMRLPEHLVESFMVKEVKLRVKRKYLRHEPEVSSLLTTLHGRVFIDVGANVGYYAFLLHNNFELIIAVEPHPKNFQIIQRVKEKYGYHKVNILPRAVSNKDGETRLYSGSHCGGHGLLNVFPYSPQEHRHIIQRLKPTFLPVHAVTLNTLLQTVESVDLVKVDVEGAEWKVLEGANKVRHKIKSWLIELHDLTRKTELEDLMKSFDYKAKWVDFRHLYLWKTS
jgi:FkbM family methyltransferase